MKKAVLLVLIIIALLASMYGILYTINIYYDGKIKEAYTDHIGDEQMREKDQGIALQTESLNRSDNIQIHGSSELGTQDIYTHPSNMFQNKSTGFQVNLIGRGHSQSLIHAINIAALKGNLKGKKMVFIISPQWFTETSLGPNEFEMNFSELQFYTMMFDNDINKNIKASIAKRTETLLKGSKDYNFAYNYAKLYSSKDIFSKAELIIFTPYYKLKCYLLSIKDKVQSYKAISNFKYNDDNKVVNKSFNWQQELDKAEEVGKEKANNNVYDIENNYYTKYIKNNLESLKGAYKGSSYLISPEYEDLKILLDLCKEKGINPIIVSVPVQGKWYDYCEFPKEERNKYYNKINELVKNYNFHFLDLSSHENDPHFLKDIMHLGWKGWIYIDKEIDEYYHNNN